MSGTVAPDLPIWAQWFAALAVPIAGVVGVILGLLNFMLARTRRRDALFDRRFEFLVELRSGLEKIESEVERKYFERHSDIGDPSVLLPLVRGESQQEVARLSKEFIEEMSLKAELLFGDEIGRYFSEYSHGGKNIRSYFSGVDFLEIMKPYIQVKK